MKCFSSICNAQCLRGSRRPWRIWQLLLFAMVLFLLAGCSIQEFVVDELSNALTSSGGAGVFLGDDDPQLVADALPFAIKLYESLLAMNPDHEGLLLTTGSLYIMYANAFIQGPANRLELEEFDKQVSEFQRARKLYLRGRDIVSSIIEMRYPGFNDALLKDEGLDPYLEGFTEDDVPFLYWLASGWFAPVTIDSFDLDILLRLPAVLKVLNRAYELEPEFNNGAFEELFISVYAALPEAMGGGHDKAMEAFERAMALQNGSSAGPYVSLALSVARPQQNADWFIELMEAALAVDVDAHPQNRLINTITQERARWYLDHIDDFFIL